MTKREKELQGLRHRINRLEKLRDQAIRDLVMTESRLPALRKRHKQLTDTLLRRETAKLRPTITDEQIKHELFPGLAAVGEQFIRESASMGACDYPTPPAKKEAPVPADAPVMTKPSEQNDGLDVPEYLDRSRRLQTLPDPKTKEKKAERRAVEREVQQADLTGKRRKMPLTGKAAFDAIRDSR